MDGTSSINLHSPAKIIYQLDDDWRLHPHYLSPNQADEEDNQSEFDSLHSGATSYSQPTEHRELPQAVSTSGTPHVVRPKSTAIPAVHLSYPSQSPLAAVAAAMALCKTSHRQTSPAMASSHHSTAMLHRTFVSTTPRMTTSYTAAPPIVMQ